MPPITAKVTVVVELQARFDEGYAQANIHWAKRLTEAGVHIFLRLAEKIHAKLFHLTKEGDDAGKCYAHIGTGNFNEKRRLSVDTAADADARIPRSGAGSLIFIENPIARLGHFRLFDGFHKTSRSAV